MSEAPKTSSARRSITVHYLEMRNPSDLRPKRSAYPEFRVDEALVKQWEVNRFLYALVGGGWEWTFRTNWPPERWRAYVEDPRLRTFIARFGGAVAGYYELRMQEGPEVEIGIFGLAPHFTGKGLGGALLTDALERAWATGPRRVWLHTCSLDHPSALPNYRARGMHVYDVRHGLEEC
jgi:GNAT superfamily N-acetyltransferase